MQDLGKAFFLIQTIILKKAPLIPILAKSFQNVQIYLKKKTSILISNFTKVNFNHPLAVKGLKQTSHARLI